jgi:transposase
MRLNIVKSKNAQQFYVIESYRTAEGKNTSRIIEKLGTYEKLKEIHDDPVAWAKEYVNELNRRSAESGKKVTVDYYPAAQISKDTPNLYNGGYIFLQKIFNELNLKYICKKISSKYKFEYDLSDVLSRLIYNRILFPSSKSACFEYSKTLLESSDFTLDDIYHSLDVIAAESYNIQSDIYKFSKDITKRNDSVIYYDCTNFFFEIESESGIRKYGKSKEHRPNPIVQMGMMMDGDGIPLAMCIDKGNTNEQKTLIPLEQKIADDFNHSKFIICTDAGLSSIKNRKFNNTNERAYITVQSIKKMKAFQKEWALSHTDWRLPGHEGVFNLDDILESEELTSKYFSNVFYKEEWYNENDIDQKYIATFSIKYMNYQRNIRNEQIERARNAISSSDKSDRRRSTDFKRFIKKVKITNEGEVAEKTQYFLDEELIANEEIFDGFYCIATNLEDPAPEIIRINKRRWEIEESFRIMKTDFKSRPVYLSKDNRIKAHFIVCFISLIIFRYLEKRLGHKYTCEEIIEGLRDYKFTKAKDFGFIPAYTRTEFTDDLHNAFGFRTDYEIISKSKMNHILKLSKERKNITTNL